MTLRMGLNLCADGPTGSWPTYGWEDKADKTLYFLPWFVYFGVFSI